jgi:hypothetical protein
MCTLLRQQLDDVADRVSRVVAVTHMLPSRALLAVEGAGERDIGERFLDAFMGSERLGEELCGRPEVVRILCGHYHRARRVTLPGARGELPCEVSPVGYPRELSGSLAEQVARRVRVVEI